MLLKARPCLGDPETGQRVMGLIDEILGNAPPPNPRTFHEMRTRMDRERGGKGKEGVHLKLGPGGMADVEFLVQFQQLRRWAEDPEVRLPSTPRVIERLVASRVLSQQEGQSLTEAHRLLKGVENRLGLVLDHKGTDQPFTSEELKALGPLEEMDWAPSRESGETLPDLLDRVRANVREIYMKRLLGTGAEPDETGGQ
jgi:[glutamine synthetase] adenylyltransferase / [glutamine synthetase]-adenylyl-L-tyrosine phosphorylase